MKDADGRAEEAKQRGNDAFRRSQFAEAIGSYTEAIMLSKDNPIYYLNRSMAYMKLNKFIDAERDASAAIRLDKDNVKALFRRGSARKHLEKWKEAQQDFESVVRIDPRNTEAKSELVDITEKLKGEKLPRPPIELRSDRIDSNTKPSSVEAARKFLEQVDVADNKTSTKQASLKGSKLLNRFPGESGSCMREVSTRKISKDTANTDSSGSIAAERYVSSSISPATQETSNGQPPDPRRFSKLPEKPSPLQGRVAEEGKLQLNAYQFFQELRHCSAIAEEERRISSQLALLESIDANTIPTMLGSLLEPELLSELLQILLRANSEKSTLVIEMMSILPQCERFETAWMFLDVKEKLAAEQVLASIRLTRGNAAANSVQACWGGRL